MQPSEAEGGEATRLAGMTSMVLSRMGTLMGRWYNSLQSVSVLGSVLVQSAGQQLTSTATSY